MVSKDQREKAFLISKHIEWETVGDGIQRKILSFDNQIMMVSVRFEKGSIGALHHHPHRQVGYVASGRFEMTIDGNKAILEQGDSFFVAPDLIHGVLALENGMLIDVFTPARADFL